jgi:hypothetical protein
MSIQWDEWLNLHDCKLWEAVALSLNYDPHVIWTGCPAQFRTVDKGPRLEIAEPEHFQDYGKRLRILENQMGRPDGPGGYVGASRVQIRLFAQWARKLKWAMPEELIKLARKRQPPAKPTAEPAVAAAPPNTPAESAVSVDEKVLTDRSRRLMLKIIRVLAVQAEVPETNAGEAVLAWAEKLDIDGLKADTVRRILKEAREAFG